MPDEAWQGRVEGALQAHFRQPDGSSRPGADWAIGLKRGAETRKVLVRAYLADGVRQSTRDDTDYQGRTVLGYVFERLGAGWHPDDGPLPGITILDPASGNEAPAPRRNGWLSRLFGR